MRVVCNGVAKVRIIGSGEIVEVQADMLVWRADGEGEGPMGARLCHSAVVDIESESGENAGQVTWSLWEYPVGVEEHKGNAAVGGVDVIEEFDFCLEHEAEEADEG